jgi:hypothetical protein
MRQRRWLADAVDWLDTYCWTHRVPHRLRRSVLRLWERTR